MPAKQYINKIESLILLSSVLLSGASFAEGDMGVSSRIPVECMNVNQKTCDSLSDVNKVLDWASKEYPELLKDQGETFSIEGYIARKYSATQVYLGSKDREIYGYGSQWGGLIHFGSLEKFLALIPSALPVKPSNDSPADKLINVELFLFGQGRAASHDGALSVDTSNLNSKMTYSRSDSEQLTLTATPAADSEIASWHGCDLISADLTTCTIALNTDQQVTANFKYKKVETTAAVHNLMAADINVDINSIDVTADTLNHELIKILASIKVGDFVAGDEKEGFLRKVTTIQKISTTRYIFSTVDASLNEVIAKGTVLFSRQMTHSGLASSAQIAGKMVRTKGMTVQLENALPGVRLLAPKNSNDTEFIIQLGQPSDARPRSLRVDKSFEIPLIPSVDSQKHPPILSAQGKLSVKLKTNISADYSFFGGGLKQFNLLVEPEITEELTLSAQAGIKKRVEQQVGGVNI